MLQDFLAGRSSVHSGTTASAAPAALGNSFQPFFAARAAELTSLGGAPRIAAAAEPELLDAPQIELVQENGKVQRIVVTCTCCRRIELECEY